MTCCRIRNGSIRVTDAVRIGAIEEAASNGTAADLVASPDAVLAELPAREIPETYVPAARNGAAIPIAALDDGDGLVDGSLVRLTAGGTLIGVHRVDGSAVKAEVVTV